MKILIRIFVLFIIVLFNTSCYTYVSFVKSSPPEIILEEPKNSIAFINSFDYTIPDENTKNENDVYQSGITEIIEGFKTLFAENEQIDFHIIDTLSRGKAQTGFSDTLSAYWVKDICRTNNFSMLLVLETFKIGINSEVEESEESNTANYYLIETAGLSLYSSSGDLIDRSTVGRSLLYKSRWALGGIAIFEPSIYKAEKDIRYLAKFVAEDYVNKFYPGTETVHGKIYTGTELNEAADYCKGQNWDKAIELLKPLAMSPDPKISGKAAYNLSVAYEATGNDRASELWLQKSGKSKQQNPLNQFLSE
jgi:hypothetical protein